MGQPVGDRGVVVVHVASEVLNEHQRRAGRFRELAVGESDPAGFDELSGHGVAGGLADAHWRFLSGFGVIVGVGDQIAARPPSAAIIPPVMEPDPGEARERDHGRHLIRLGRAVRIVVAPTAAVRSRGRIAV